MFARATLFVLLACTGPFWAGRAAVVVPAEKIVARGESLRDRAGADDFDFTLPVLLDLVQVGDAQTRGGDATVRPPHPRPQPLKPEEVEREERGRRLAGA